MQPDQQQQEQEARTIDLSVDPPLALQQPANRPRRRPRRPRRTSDLHPSQPVDYLPQPQPQPQLHQPQQPPQDMQLETRVTRVIDFEKAYFECYAHVGVHEEMIRDRVRTDTYKAAIMHHRPLIEGKVVLDVGCGTGILSIFCAQAGAKRVYAVEASSIALQAKSVVKENNLSNIVIVLHGRVEDVEINEKVDVIVSEWMGYMLLYENMLGSVISARDRWLKPGGLILPSSATLYMAAVTHARRYSGSVDFWRDVYGINMSAMVPLAKQCAFEEPSVETITDENVLTLPHVVKLVNCHSVTIPELKSITTSFKIKSMMQAPLHGFAFWFDVKFEAPVPAPVPISCQLSISSVYNRQVDSSPNRNRTNSDESLVISTGPFDPETHWQQTLIYLYDPIEVEQDQVIEGSVALSQSKENARFMNIYLQYSTGDRSYVKESIMK